MVKLQNIKDKEETVNITRDKIKNPIWRKAIQWAADFSTAAIEKNMEYFQSALMSV